MNKFITSLFALFLFIMFAHAETPLMVSSAPSNEAAGLELRTLEEFEVTATKENTDIKKLPVSSTIIGTETLERSDALSIKEFSAKVPNMFMPDYGSKLTSPLYIRGVGSRINAPSVGLYVDQVPFFEKSMFDIDLFDIESIEILRGPQGTLYGRNTMGGLIHVISKSPLKYQGTKLAISGGNYDYLKANVSHYAKIGEKVSVSVAGNFHHSGGLFTNEYDGAQVDAANSGGGRLRWSWKINDHWKLERMSTYEYSDQGGYPYALYNKQTGVLSPISYDEPSSYRRQMLSNALVLENQTDKYTLIFTSCYQYFNDMQAIDQDFTPLKMIFATQAQRQSLLSQEILAKSKPGSPYQWLTGFFAFIQQTDNTINVHYRDLAAAFHKTPGSKDQMIYDSPTSGVALFHQSTLRSLAVKGLDLTLGARLDYEKSTLDYTASNISPTNDITPLKTSNSDLDFFRFVPKIVLSYAIVQNSMIYASATNGYKTGGFNTTFERDEDRSFNPETSWNYEIGTKTTLIEGKLMAEASLFYIDWKNQQIYQPLPSGVGSMLKNAGRSESKGGELSIRAVPFRTVQTYLNYGYTRAVYKENERSSTLSYSGNYIPYIPRHTLSVGSDFTLPVKNSVIESVTLSLEYQGVGRIYWTESNDVQQPYYGLWNTRLTARAGKITFDLWARNVFEKSYKAFYFEAIGNGYVQKGLPMLCGMNVSLQL